MLRLMLDAHPELTIPPETFFLPELMKARRKEGELSADRVIEILTAERRWADFEVDADELRSRFGSRDSVSPRRAARSFYALYAKRQRKPRWGDKTPGYAIHIRPIGRLLPEARFVHLIRDGRDIVVSRALRRDDVNVEWEAKKWLRLVRTARRQGARVGRYMEVRYEDLVLDPEPALRAICDFTELDFDPIMLRYYEQADERMSEIYRDLPAHSDSGSRHRTAEERRALHKNTVEPPNPDLVGYWQEHLTDEQVRTYEGVAGELLRDLGHEVKTAMGSDPT